LPRAWGQWPSAKKIKKKILQLLLFLPHSLLLPDASRPSSAPCPPPPSAAAAPAPGEVTAAKHRVRLCSPRAGTSSWARSLATLTVLGADGGGPSPHSRIAASARPTAVSRPPHPLPPGSCSSQCSTRTVPPSSVRQPASPRLRHLLRGSSRVSHLDPALIYSSRPLDAGRYTACARRGRRTTGRSSSTTGTGSRSWSTSTPR